MWLLETSVRQAIQAAQEAGFTPSAEQQAEFEARLVSVSATGADNRLLTVAGSSAEIAVNGVITKAPSFMAMIFGGGNTTYPDIISAIAAAEQDDTVRDITLKLDSPGGHIDGLFDTLAAIQAAKKPITAMISNVAASATYALASQTDKIVASNVAVRVGSIGIAANFHMDASVVSVTSTDAPNKRPDVSTEAGRAAVREELDAMHEIFVDAIASGRGTTVETINADFGRGATVLANEALQRGMIDAIAGAPLKVVKSAKSPTANSGNQPEANNMDLKTLQAQHPETYAAAVQQGVTQELDRVSAHLIMGETSGDMKTACAAIKDGSPMTATLQATYMTAGMNRSDMNDRQDDDLSANAGDNANAQDDEDQGGDVASLIESKLGLGE